MTRPTLARGTPSKAAQCLPFFSKNPNQNPPSQTQQDRPLVAFVRQADHRAPDDIDELVFVSVPMALTGPGARAQLLHIDAELGKAGGQPEPTPGLVLAGFVEWLGIARSGARTGASNIDLHVPISQPRS